MNYSSRFRVNIGQLQTLLALLYDTLAPQLPRSCHERVEEILADPSGGTIIHAADEPPDSVCYDCSHARGLHLQGPCLGVSEPAGVCGCGRFVYAECAPPLGVIHAAEGVVLEPGEYETCVGRVTTPERVSAILFDDDEWVFEFRSPSGAVCQYTAVRRVEPQAPKEIPQPASAEASLISTPSRGQHPSCGPEPQAPQFEEQAQ